MTHLTALSHWFYQKASWRMLVFSGLCFLCFMIFVLPPMAERTHVATGSSQSPDTSFVYSAQDLYHMAASYGPEGRSFYIRSRFTFDIAWPLAYLWFLTVALSVAGRNLPRKEIQLGNLLPLAGFTFDILENSSASWVMHVYPQETLIAHLAPVATLLKWLCIGGSFFCLVLFVVLKTVQSRRH